MNGLAILVVAATLGVDYSWQYADDGKLEYLIQLEPSLVRSMENGLTVTSEIEPQLRGVRRFRISVGTGSLPRDAIRHVSAEEPLSPGDRIGRLDQPQLHGNDPPPGAKGEPNHVHPNGGTPIEQAAAKPADSSAESPSDNPPDKSTKDDSAALDDTDATTNSPWFVGAIIALCASLGVNFYQGWNLKSARRRYFQLVDRLGLRSSPSSEGVSIEG